MRMITTGVWVSACLAIGLAVGMGVTGCTATEGSDRETSHGSAYDAGMMQFQHVVHFWLRDGLTDAERAEFVAACRGLGESPNVAAVRVGVPAETPREIVDNSYGVQLTCWFESAAAHERYQEPDDVHRAFIESQQDKWTRVLIYDSIEAGEH